LAKTAQQRNNETKLHEITSAESHTVYYNLPSVYDLSCLRYNTIQYIYVRSKADELASLI